MFFKNNFNKSVFTHSLMALLSPVLGYNKMNLLTFLCFLLGHCNCPLPIWASTTSL